MAELAATAHRLVVVEALDNPVNVGSVVRNAAALGWDGLVLDHQPILAPFAAGRNGHAFSLPHARTQHLADELRSLADFELYAMTPDPAAQPLDEVRAGHRAAVLIGSERSGLSEELIGLSIPVRIPMADGVDSLNAAAATAVVCWALYDANEDPRSNRRPARTSCFSRAPTGRASSPRPRRSSADQC